MKCRPLAAASILVLLSLPEVCIAADGVVQIWGTGALSCGTWMEDKNKPTQDARIDQEWVVGFFSAYNVYHRKEAVSVPDVPALLVWIDNYCRSHPLDAVVSATDQMIDELRGRIGLPPLHPTKR